MKSPIFAAAGLAGLLVVAPLACGTAGCTVAPPVILTVEGCRRLCEPRQVEVLNAHECRCEKPAGGQ